MLVTLYAKLRDPGLISETCAPSTKLFTASVRPCVSCQTAFYPHTKWASGTNTCFIGLEVDQRTERVIVLAAVDNLVKGQSGQAIQAMNINQGLRRCSGCRRSVFIHKP